MNNKKGIKLIILAVCALIVVGLIGCGGGGSDTDSGNNGGMTYVAGDFKTASTPDEYSTSDVGAYGSSNGSCTGESYYFESANVLVYGSYALPEDDFEYAATLVENNLSEAFNLMGVSHDEFNDYRPQYTPQAVRRIISVLEYYTNADGEDSDITDIPSTGFNKPDNWENLETYLRKGYLKAYWSEISDSKQAEFADFYNEIYSGDVLYGNKIPEKIGVCLDSTANSTMYGQGTLFGMNLAPKSQASRDDAGQVVLHELIHAIQLNVATPTDSNEIVIDRWFMEGQASFLAGQKVADSASNYYPVNVVDSYDFSVEFQGDGGVAYPHYAKAYSYINAYSKESILEFLLDVRVYTGGGSNNGFSNESGQRFSSAFDANMKKSDGSPLTLEDFRNNYHSLVD